MCTLPQCPDQDTDWPKLRGPQAGQPVSDLALAALERSGQPSRRGLHSCLGAIPEPLFVPIKGSRRAVLSPLLVPRRIPDPKVAWLAGGGGAGGGCLALG